MRLSACEQRELESGANLVDKGFEWDFLVGLVYDEQLARFGFGAPGCMERDEVPPCIARPHWQYTHMAGCAFEPLGYVRSQPTIEKERLGVARGHEVEFSIVVEFPNCEEGSPFCRSTQRQRGLQLRTLRVGRSPPGEQAMRMLARYTELAGEICHRQALPPQ
jgi:hypothetical protein